MLNDHFIRPKDISFRGVTNALPCSLSSPMAEETFLLVPSCVPICNISGQKIETIMGFLQETRKTHSQFMMFFVPMHVPIYYVFFLINVLQSFRNNIITGINCLSPLRLYVFSKDLTSHLTIFWRRQVCRSQITILGQLMVAMTNKVDLFFAIRWRISFYDSYYYIYVSLEWKLI